FIALFTGFLWLDGTYNHAWVKRSLLFYICALALIKFSFFIAILSLLGICVIDRICRRDFKGARELVAASVISLVFLWLALGRSSGGFFQFPGASQQIASGYPGALSLPPPRRLLKYGVPAAIFFFCALAMAFTIARKSRSVIAPAMIIMLFSF